jgi:anti-sigma regulatory factor (Ser/Thr protein kinase)
MGKRKDFHLELTSDAEKLRDVRDAIRAWADEDGWEEHDIADIVLAVDEALTNVIRHSYGGEPGQRILVDVKAIDEPRRSAAIEIRIRDFGKQVPLDSIAGRDLADLRPGGLGVHIIHCVMEGARYRHMPDGGTELYMKKYRARRPAGGDSAPAS